MPYPTAAPDIGPAIELALAPLLASGQDADDPTRPVFQNGAAMFVNGAAEGVQTVLEAILRSRGGNPGEILTHAQHQLSVLAQEHLPKKPDQKAAVAVVMAFLRGSFSLLPLMA